MATISARGWVHYTVKGMNAMQQYERNRIRNYQRVHLSWRGCIFGSCGSYNTKRSYDILLSSSWLSGQYYPRYKRFNKCGKRIQLWCLFSETWFLWVQRNKSLSWTNPDKRSKSGNGRMYDPLAGRFISADGFVQSPAATQCRRYFLHDIFKKLWFIKKMEVFPRR